MILILMVDGAKAVISFCILSAIPGSHLGCSKSQGYLQDIFNWQWCYYTVTNKGVAFLVKALGAPDVVPATYKKKRGGAGMDAPKMADDGEGKPAPDGETPGGMGRGAR